jgi:hypothetical protein
MFQSVGELGVAAPFLAERSNERWLEKRHLSFFWVYFYSPVQNVPQLLLRQISKAACEFNLYRLELRGRSLVSKTLEELAVSSLASEIASVRVL